MKVYPKGRIKRIHVHQQRIRKGEPALTVQYGGTSGGVYWSEVDVLGPSRVIHSDKPLSCGARAYIETTAEVVAR